MCTVCGMCSRSPTKLSIDLGWQCCSDWQQTQSLNSFWALITRDVDVGFTASFSSCRKILVEPPCCVKSPSPQVLNHTSTQSHQSNSNQFLVLQSVGLTVLALLLSPRIWSRIHNSQFIESINIDQSKKSKTFTWATAPSLTCSVFFFTWF